MSMSQSVNEEHKILIEAASQFAEWVTAQAPNATVALCGGLAVWLYGGNRSTSDADMCMDLRSTRRRGPSGRPFDTNLLKQLAAQDREHFTVGLKVYWLHHPTGRPVQVDFVDANMFYSPFFREHAVDFSSQRPLLSLNVQMLLVAKLRCASERSQADPAELLKKQYNDIIDFDFLLYRCISHNLKLHISHIQHLGDTDENIVGTIHAFSSLRANLSEQQPDSIENGEWKVQWMQLISGSNLPQLYGDAVQI